MPAGNPKAKGRLAWGDVVGGQGGVFEDKATLIISVPPQNSSCKCPNVLH